MVKYQLYVMTSIMAAHQFSKVHTQTHTLARTQRASLSHAHKYIDGRMEGAKDGTIEGLKDGRVGGMEGWGGWKG